jgi:uncharacterized protein YukE
MSGHFSLDVDPGAVREASRMVGTLAAHVETKAHAVSSTPGEIGGEWTGHAATAIKAEMTGLGSHMDGFAEHLRSTRKAIDSLADDYDHARDQVRRLNQQYDAAQSAYEHALTAAANRREATLKAAKPDTGPLNRAIVDDIDSTQQAATSTAYDERQAAFDGLEKQFAHLRHWVAERTRAAGASLSHAVPVPVPPSVVSAYQKTGTYPVRLDRSVLEQGLALTRQVDDEVGTEVTEEEQESLLEKLEPYRKINEAVHTGWDAGFLDPKLESLLKVALDNAEGMPKTAAEAAEAVQRTEISIMSLEAMAKNGLASDAQLAELAQLKSSVGGLQAAADNAADAAASATRLARGLTGLSRVLGVTGVAGDLLTVIDPPDDGVMGVVDRGAAGVNGTLLAVNLFTDEIPVAGEVVMIGTGLYLAGNFLYHHWGAFHDVCDDIGHGTVKAVDWVGDEATSAYHTASHAVSSAVDEGGKIVDGATDVASDAWHGVTSIL